MYLRKQKDQCSAMSSEFPEVVEYVIHCSATIAMCRSLYTSRRSDVWPKDYVKSKVNLAGTNFLDGFDLFDPTALAKRQISGSYFTYLSLPEDIRLPRAIVHKQIVGGLYDSAFNYMREILG